MSKVKTIKMTPDREREVIRQLADLSSLQQLKDMLLDFWEINLQNKKRVEELEEIINDVSPMLYNMGYRPNTKN